MKKLLVVLISIAAALLPLFVCSPTAATAEYKGELLADFSTYYSTSSPSRKENIRLATQAIDGLEIAPEKVFSFNETVGERTEERGYKSSKIIKNGQYTGGVGGGVCQVSTTLYNAVLRAGLTVTSVSRHTLPASYIPRSFDAMVSSGTDFCFVNDTPYPVFLYAKADGKRLRVKVFGFPVYCDGETVAFRSELIKEIPCDEYEEIVAPEQLEEGEEARYLSHPKSGYVTEAYRDHYFGGKKTASVRLRKDYYAPQKGRVILRYPSIGDAETG